MVVRQTNGMSVVAHSDRRRIAAVVAVGSTLGAVAFPLAGSFTMGVQAGWVRPVWSYGRQGRSRDEVAPAGPSMGLPTVASAGLALAGAAFLAARSQRHGGRVPCQSSKQPGSPFPCAKASCVHPDRDDPYLCGDCPRNGKRAVAAFLTSAKSLSVHSEWPQSKTAAAALVSSAKATCIHPDRDDPYLCGDCPRNGKVMVSAPAADEVVPVVAGKAVCASAAFISSAKASCIHPDRDDPYLCGDCPRNGKVMLCEEKRTEGRQQKEDQAFAVPCKACAVAAFVSSAKSTCVHPDRDAPYLFGDCPRN
eukprot:CAMPEP_0183386596 /NCGR_PEP_ID=MMETSP0370-20130417/2487_1 /TAXON_ID=268820 /ORGANISM="Peridinium aciculiferum, Strain PAER-2" /LENGTH=306 /DNA_ID=CAMNT_0025564949 /DNA_START=72 /DNA_END=992 /DNA_ORIENTATION=-